MDSTKQLSVFPTSTRLWWEEYSDNEGEGGYSCMIVASRCLLPREFQRGGAANHIDIINLIEGQQKENTQRRAAFE